MFGRTFGSSTLCHNPLLYKKPAAAFQCAQQDPFSPNFLLHPCNTMAILAS